MDKLVYNRVINMAQKVIVAVISFLVLGFVGYFIFTNIINKSPKTNFDFGDAPDGGQGQFPSLLKSNGARAKKTDDVWLGQAVTTELDSKQVNSDEADDGVRGKAVSCQESTVYFFVQSKNPGKTSGTAYLNLYADWNKDGRWSGSDECASEWAVQNFPVDLEKQKDEIAVYTPTFTAGKKTDKIWFRGAVTLNQQMNETATGEFASGEIEDYGPKEPGDERYYNFYCDPDPLIIKHGSQGSVNIVPDWGSEPIFDAQFGKNYQPKNAKRKVAMGKDNIFTFESSDNDIDPPKRSVPHFVDIRVRFGAGGKEAVLEKACRVIVEHDEAPIEIPGRRSFPVPSEVPKIETESGDSTVNEPAGSPHTESVVPTSAPPVQEGAPGFMKN